MKTIFTILSFVGLYLMSGQALGQSRDATATIKRTIEIGQAWAGHRVGFALHTHRHRQYIAYYNGDRHIVVGQRRLQDSIFQLDTLPAFERESREGTSTILGWDSHNYLTLTVDDRGYIHLAGNMHVNGLTYFRSERSGDITSMEQIPSMVGSLENRCTYPRFFVTLDGSLIFRYRDGGSGNGSEVYNIYNSASETWSRLLDVPLIDGQGLMNAYCSTPTRGPDGWYHMYWVWRDTPDCATNHDLSYIKSPNMKDWFDAADQPLELPVTYDGATAVVDPIPPGGGIINLGAKLTFDADRQPVMVYHKYGPAGNLQLFVATRFRNQWISKQITNWDYRWEFSGRGSIVNEFKLIAFDRRPDEKYEVSYDHIKLGQQTLLLDKDFMNLGTIPKSAPFVSTLSISGTFPGLERRWIENELGQSTSTHILTWESLPSNRDRPRPLPWPEPSPLTLFELEPSQEPATISLHWRNYDLKDICRIYPDRISSLLSSLDLTSPSLGRVATDYATGNYTDAAMGLLSYYRANSSASSWSKPLQTDGPSTSATADSILAGYITVQEITGKPKRDALGHLDWDYAGPRDDKEFAWGFNRQYHLRTLLDAYQETGNRKYVQAIDAQIRDWVLKSAPYPAVKSSTAMWRGLEVSFRAKLWARVFYELMDHPDFSEGTRLLLLSSLPEHAHYAREFHAKGNWLTMELSGLATIATAWPEFTHSSSWLAYTKVKMEESLLEQVYPDGVQTELTSHYHYVALNNFAQFKSICDDAGEPLSAPYLTALERMWDYLAYSMRPDGYGAMNNDSDLDYNQSRVAIAGEQNQRQDWQYIASNGRIGTAPRFPARFFPWAGQLVMRSGFDRDAEWGFFDVGPWGSGHQHSDKLHLSISAFQQDFLVDAGRFAYRGEVADNFRDYARSSRGHNTILIDGKLQSRGPLKAKELLGDRHFFIDSMMSYATNSQSKFEGLVGEAEHTRAVCHLQGHCWIVVDQVTSDRPREIETLWHWHPDCTIQDDGRTIQGSRKNGNVFVSNLSPVALKTRKVSGQMEPVVQGWYSQRYNRVEPNPMTSYSGNTNEGNVLVWLIEATKESESQIKAKLLSQDKEGVMVELNDKDNKSQQLYIPFRNSALLNHRFLR